MQRWILLGITGCVLLAALVFGANYARKEYRLGKPSQFWVPMGLRLDTSMADQKKMADEIKSKIFTDEFLLPVAKDLNIQEKFQLGSEALAIMELKKKVYVEVSSMDTPEGQVPTINVGLRGIGREKEFLQKGTLRIMNDVWILLGVDPKTGKPLDPEVAPSKP